MKLDHCHRESCTRIIDALQARVAELEAENAELKKLINDPHAWWRGVENREH